MARDIEVVEANSEADLDSQVQTFIGVHALKISDISYDTYTDYETEELIYVASIFIQK